ncbi:hypothetical protein BU24DRAFT_491722 [Aaosphaeria arxii CBS 175.79]|uniref:Uncharacterized protein n=1 Tax=Aaosphaeria arxii CBS 175.79 TaxID=1450172 RepID=A0A6A5XQP0_9PLEO|nr:uncharacterized protein BU24DRAFT_491722 [Aaosphaeria arxii CBS 175.79]KAF2015482.1 hypothetical protein BU24DRAFT_491722 [Aaosphaeria arxii CBS 175.79]
MDKVISERPNSNGKIRPVDAGVQIENRKTEVATPLPADQVVIGLLPATESSTESTPPIAQGNQVALDDKNMTATPPALNNPAPLPAQIAGEVIDPAPDTESSSESSVPLLNEITAVPAVHTQNVETIDLTISSDEIFPNANQHMDFQPQPDKIDTASPETEIVIKSSQNAIESTQSLTQIPIVTVVSSSPTEELVNRKRKYTTSPNDSSTVNEAMESITKKPRLSPPSSPIQCTVNQPTNLTPLKAPDLCASTEVQIEEERILCSTHEHDSDSIDGVYSVVSSGGPDIHVDGNAADVNGTSDQHHDGESVDDFYSVTSSHGPGINVDGISVDITGTSGQQHEPPPSPQAHDVPSFPDHDSQAEVEVVDLTVPDGQQIASSSSQEIHNGQSSPKPDVQAQEQSSNKEKPLEPQAQSSSTQEPLEPQTTSQSSLPSQVPTTTTPPAEHPSISPAISQAPTKPTPTVENPQPSPTTTDIPAPNPPDTAPKKRPQPKKKPKAKAKPKAKPKPKPNPPPKTVEDGNDNDDGGDGGNKEPKTTKKKKQGTKRKADTTPLDTSPVAKRTRSRTKASGVGL